MLNRCHLLKEPGSVGRAELVLECKVVLAAGDAERHAPAVMCDHCAHAWLQSIWVSGGRTNQCGAQQLRQDKPCRRHRDASPRGHDIGHQVLRLAPLAARPHYGCKAVKVLVAWQRRVGPARAICQAGWTGRRSEGDPMKCMLACGPAVAWTALWRRFVWGRGTGGAAKGTGA